MNTAATHPWPEIVQSQHRPESLVRGRGGSIMSIVVKLAKVYAKKAAMTRWGSGVWLTRLA